MGPGILLDVGADRGCGEGYKAPALAPGGRRGRPSPHQSCPHKIRGIESWRLLERRKTEQVEKLSKELKNVSNVVVATYTKMTVAQDYELRKALRSAGAKYQVVKNTLAERAAKGTKVEGALKDLAGVTSIAYTTGDPVAHGQGADQVRQGHAGVHLQGRAWSKAA